VWHFFLISDNYIVRIQQSKFDKFTFFIRQM